jgi:hypothetical protein
MIAAAALVLLGTEPGILSPDSRGPAALASARIESGDRIPGSVPCRKCQATGRVPCPEHEKDQCALEDGVLYCSFVADCPSCGGAAFLSCPECKDEAVGKRLEEKRAKVETRRIALKGLDESMGRALRKGETDHFVLVWEIDRHKVDKKWLDDHQALHLYLERLEQLFADYCGRMRITEKEFVEKSRVFVWYFPQDHWDGSLRFCKQSAKGGVKLLGQSPSYSICGNKQFFKGDEQLHRNIVHSVTHLLLSSQRPVAWVGNVKGGWADEGLAHFFEDRYWGICDTYCFQEADTNVDFKGGRFKLAVRRMVEEGSAPQVAEVFEQNVDTLTLPMHAVSLSYVDYLLNKDAEKFNELMKKLKAKVPTRDALKDVFGFGPLEFEGLWKAWVLQTYPAR